MEDEFPTEVNVALNYLLDNVVRLGLLDLLFLVQHLHEVAMGAVLCNYVIEVFGLICIVELNNVRVTEISMHFYLALQHRNVRRFELFQIYHFYGIFFIRMANMARPIDFAAEPFPHQILLPIFVVPHSYVFDSRGADKKSLLWCTRTEGLEDRRFLLEVLFWKISG